MTWQPASQGLPTNDFGLIEVNGLAADTSHPGTLYAVASDCIYCEGGDVLGGVYRSQDGGATWSVFGSGMRSRAVTSLTIDATGTVLHAGTTGGGVFDYENYSFESPDRMPVEPVAPGGRQTRRIDQH